MWSLVSYFNYFKIAIFYLQLSRAADSLEVCLYLTLEYYIITLQILIIATCVISAVPNSFTVHKKL